MTTAAKAFIATPFGMVIAAVALGLAALKAAFTGSEEGQNKFTKIMAVINVVLGNFQDLLADLGESIIEVFENPGESLKKFGDLIKDNITTRFDGILNLIPNLAKAVEALFNRDFAGAAKIASDSVGKVFLGVESVTDSLSKAKDAIVDFGKQTAIEVGKSNKVEDDRAKAAILARNLIVDGAKIEAEIAELRLKAKTKDKFSAEERKGYILEAQELQDKLLAKELKVLTLRRDAQIVENSFSKTNIENENKEAEAKAAVSQVETERLNQQRATQIELNKLTIELGKDELQLKKAQIEAELILVKEGTSREYELRLQLINESLEIELQTAGDNLLAKNILEQEAFNERLKLEKEFNDEKADLEEKEKVKSDKASSDKIKSDKKEKDAAIKKEKDILENKKKQREQDLTNLGTILGKGELVQKAFALKEIGIDTGKAIASLTASSEANPANGVTFGGAGIAQFLSGLLRIGANIASAKALLSGSTSVPTSSGAGDGGGMARSVSGSAGMANVNAS